MLKDGQTNLEETEFAISFETSAVQTIHYPTGSTYPHLPQKIHQMYVNIAHIECLELKPFHIMSFSSEHLCSETKIDISWI